MSGRVPFNRVHVAGRELEYLQAAVEGGYLAGDGRFGRACEALLQEVTGSRRVLLTGSCTSALEMCALLLEIQPGTEVVIPSFTFVSTVNAFVLRGAVPRFIDIRPDTLNLDESQLEDAIDPRTRAVIPVHYAGVACDIDSICSIARSAGVAVVEDNAHGLFGTWRGRPLGSIGDLATLSFHETKNVTGGEGGALLVNRDDFIARAEILREKGTNRSQFFRGEVAKYEWVDVGSSYLASELQAAFLLAQLERSNEVQAERRRMWERYQAELTSWAAETGARLPVVPEDCGPAYHLFHLIMPTSRDRDALLKHLDAHDVHAVFHYVPLHASPMGRRYAPGLRLPVTEEMSARLLRLPLFRGLGPDQDRVVDAVLSFRT